MFICLPNIITVIAGLIELHNCILVSNFIKFGYSTSVEVESRFEQSEDRSKYLVYWKLISDIRHSCAHANIALIKDFSSLQKIVKRSSKQEFNDIMRYFIPDVSEIDYSKLYDAILKVKFQWKPDLGCSTADMDKYLDRLVERNW